VPLALNLGVEMIRLTQRAERGKRVCRSVWKSKFAGGEDVPFLGMSAAIDSNRVKLKGISSAQEGTLVAKILMVFSASITFTLGVVHLIYTFWGPKLTPRDPALQISMSKVAPVITNETTIWRCWVGFNVSHSIGLILFGLIFGFLALAHGQLLFQSPFLLVVGLAMLGGFVVLCKVYFFSVPLAGMSISLACYVAGVALSRTLIRHF